MPAFVGGARDTVTSKILEVPWAGPRSTLYCFPALSARIFGPRTIAPNTAVCFILLGVAACSGLGKRFCFASHYCGALWR